MSQGNLSTGVISYIHNPLPTTKIDNAAVINMYYEGECEIQSRPNLVWSGMLAGRECEDMMVEAIECGALHLPGLAVFTYIDGHSGQTMIGELFTVESIDGELTFYRGWEPQQPRNLRLTTWPPKVKRGT